MLGQMRWRAVALTPKRSRRDRLGPGSPRAGRGGGRERRGASSRCRFRADAGPLHASDGASVVDAQVCPTVMSMPKTDSREPQGGKRVSTQCGRTRLLAAPEACYALRRQESWFIRPKRPPLSLFSPLLHLRCYPRDPFLHEASRLVVERALPQHPHRRAGQGKGQCLRVQGRAHGFTRGGGARPSRRDLRGARI
jgi:hypothetical protein